MPILDNVFTAAARIRQIAIQARDAANTAWEAASPHVNAVLEAGRKLSDPEARAAIAEQVRELTEWAAQQSSTTVRSLYAGLNETANGMPPKLGLKFVTFRQLQAVAEGKNALALPQLVACQRTFDDLTTAYKADPKVDLTAGLALIDDLLAKAGTAVDEFDGSEDSVTRLSVACHSTLDDLKAIEGECSAQNARVLAIIANPTLPTLSANLVSIASLETSLGEADGERSNGNFPAAAIRFAQWSVDADRTLSCLRDQTASLAQLADKPDSLRAELTAYIERAKSKGIWGIPARSDVTQAAQDALAAMKARPCDVEVAQAKVDLFEELVR
jgi:hypothetical protein